MLWWICDGEIVGPAIAGAGLPANFEELEGPEAGDRDAVYLLDGQILLRPAKPGPTHIWIGAAWSLPPERARATPTKNWKGLEEDFRGSAIYARIYAATVQPDSNTIAALLKLQRAASAHTLLLSALTSSHSEADLQFAMAELRAVMGTMAIGDFTPEQIAFINQRLEARGFDLRLEDETN